MNWNLPTYKISPQPPRKWPFDLNDLERGSVIFLKNCISKISASSWGKWAIAWLSIQTFKNTSFWLVVLRGHQEVANNLKFKILTHFPQLDAWEAKVEGALFWVFIIVQKQCDVLGIYNFGVKRVIASKSKRGHFIYILDSSNSSSFTFWSSQFASSSRRIWTVIWTGNWKGTWTDKQSSHFITAKEIRVKAKFFSCYNHNKPILRWCWNHAEILLN